MRTWYNIKALAGAAAEISIHDEIGAFGTNAKNFINDLKRVEANEINLSINSPGGSVFDGIAIFNALRASGKTINVKVLGIAASIASVVAMAGDKITMPANAFMMVHNPWAFAKGNADEMRDFADVLDKVGESLVGTYVARTGKTAEEVRALLDDETYLTAQEAKDLGFADEIEPAFTAQASFDTDFLPENVQTAFRAAQAVDEPRGAEPAFADQVQALATQAGLAVFASDFALRNSKIAAAAEDIATAREIMALCVLAKRPDAATGYIKAAQSLADVRAALITAMATADEKVKTDTSPPGHSQAADPAGPVAVTTGGIWAKRLDHNTSKEKSK